ncbi:hypothetical protein MTR_3g052060 [Medicago truncatula]|uniref:Uncharacterized protein n=1 Tax=Medicago truncatula TaxID=3880 RepID=G7IY09_MEDTR|nr:hypothetical protein MTR_3g052060 [Medicago truncatula]
MLNIISAGITDSWNMIFGDETPFTDDEMTKVQERCASLILERVDAINQKSHSSKYTMELLRSKKSLNWMKEQILLNNAQLG